MPEVLFDHALIEIGQHAATACDPTQEPADHVETSPSAMANEAVSHETRIFNEFDAYLRTERGLALKSVVRHLPVIRRFLHEVCPAGDDDLYSVS